MSPFAHAIFTGTTGLIMGFAARRWHSGASVLAFFVGLIPAMLLHSRWNSMGAGFLAEYVLIQVPIFVLAVVGIILLRVADNRLTRQRLTEYSAAGWFSAAEVDMLATPAGRRSALRWAQVPRAGPQMKAFLHAATQLAFIRQRILSGRDVPAHQPEEQQQLAEIAALRAAVIGRDRSNPVGPAQARAPGQRKNPGRGCPDGFFGAPGAYASSDGLSCCSRPSRPLMNCGDSSVESTLASSTASLTATPSGTSSLYSSSQAPMRRMMRSTEGMRSRVQPCE